jgi:hypothetical protein
LKLVRFPLSLHIRVRAFAAFGDEAVDPRRDPVRFVRQAPIPIASSRHCKHLPRMTPGFGAGWLFPICGNRRQCARCKQGKDPPPPRLWRDKRGGAGADRIGQDFIFELLYPNLKTQAVFTVPTRALANDKLSEWRARGWDVGISTGDVALNLDAKVVVATLETQRGRFLRLFAGTHDREFADMIPNKPRMPPTQRLDR